MTVIFLPKKSNDSDDLTGLAEGCSPPSLNMSLKKQFMALIEGIFKLRKTTFCNDYIFIVQYTWPT